jgi:hypothetical protein
MFANMPGQTAIDVAGLGALGQALLYHEEEDARRSDKWRQEAVQRLEADLTTLDSLAHGFAKAAVSRRNTTRSPGRLGIGQLAIALLAIVLGIAIITVLGLRGASAAPLNPCQHGETICHDF